MVRPSWVGSASHCSRALGDGRALVAIGGGLRIAVPARRVASRVLRGQAIILHPDSDELQRTNEVGSFIWNLISARRHDEDALVALLSAAFEVEPQVARADLLAFLADAKGRGLIEFTEVSPDSTTP